MRPKVAPVQSLLFAVHSPKKGESCRSIYELRLARVADCYSVHDLHLSNYKRALAAGMDMPLSGNGGEEFVYRCLHEARKAAAYTWYIYPKEEPDRAIGAVRCYGMEWGQTPSGAVAYFLDAKEEGKGIARTAVASVIELFGGLGVKLEADVVKENERSAKLLETVGFEKISESPRWLHFLLACKSSTENGIQASFAFR